METGSTEATATGGVADMAARLASVLPRRWFPALADAPVLRAMLCGIGAGWSYCHALLGFARSQARLATVSGTFLDMAGTDFFAGALRRLPLEGDAAYRARLAGNLLREKATRAGVVASVAAATGAGVTVFEALRPADTGGYGSVSLPQLGGGSGYGVPGLAYGSFGLPFQFLLDIVRPASGSAIPSVAGYAGRGAAQMPGGFGSGAIAYGDQANEAGVVSDQDIEQAVASAIPAGSIAWMRLR